MGDAHRRRPWLVLDHVDSTERRNHDRVGIPHVNLLIERRFEDWGFELETIDQIA